MKHRSGIISVVMSHFPAALLLLASVLPASAADFPACVRQRNGRYQEPATLSALLRCQRILRDKHTLALKKKGIPFPAEDQEALADFQREEVREYLNRYPRRATIEEDPPAASSKGKKKRKKVRKKAKGAASGKTAPRKEDIAEPPAGNPPAAPSSEVIQGMIANLVLQSGETPELKELSSSVQADGETLKPWTIGKLKAYARKAKLEGRDLNLDPETERWLFAD